MLYMTSYCLLLEWLYPRAYFVNLFQKGGVLYLHELVLISILLYYLLHLIGLVVLLPYMQGMIFCDCDWGVIVFVFIYL